MRIRIEARGCDLTPALTKQAKQLLAFHLSRFTAEVVDIRLTLRANSDGVSAASRRASLRVDLGPCGVITVEQTRREAAAAVRQAARQASRAVRRALVRARPMGFDALRERRHQLR